MQKADFDALVAKAERRKAAKREVKLIDAPGVGALELHKPGDAAMLDYLGRFAEADGMEDTLALTNEIVYACCPQLQDAALHEALGVRDPLDVIPTLFDVLEQNALGERVCRWLGMIVSTAEATAKNA